MSRTVLLIAATIAFTAGPQRQAAPQAACATSTSACTEWVTLGEGPARSMIYRSYPLGTRNDAIRRALIMVHGTNRNADHYFATAMAAAFLIGFLLIMHRILPGRRLTGCRLWPGVLVTTVLWVAFASGFSIYLSFTPTYTVTYGTLAGVIITLMFFYLTGATIIFGAELNAALNRICPVGSRWRMV